ncbi:hypothetical protein KC957_00245 [Candidatus Saccharibacteria bacterium]|nr:hypothetical protein [Candidatus Saccharibacteria bacterium]
MKPDPHEEQLQYAICVSGAASGETVEQSKLLAERLGKAIAKRGHVTTTGATVGLPFYAAKGAKDAGGMSIGFSPAGSMREHLRKYRLPYKEFDFISYTGMDYVGRDSYLTQSSDAVITVGGRFGSLHEFVTALEAHKPCGVLIESGGTADIIPQLMRVLNPPKGYRVVFDENPENLVQRIVDILDEEFRDVREQLSREEHWFIDGKKHHKRAG